MAPPSIRSKSPVPSVLPRLPNAEDNSTPKTASLKGDTNPPAALASVVSDPEPEQSAGSRMSMTSARGGFPVSESHPALDEMARDLVRGDGPLAVFSGGGPTSFAAALRLRQLGYRVVVLEKRAKFTRHNVVTLKEECLATLHSVGAYERLMASEASTLKSLGVYWVARDGALSTWGEPRAPMSLDAPRAPLDPKTAFGASPIVATPIANLQHVLNETALEAGVFVARSAECSLVAPAAGQKSYKVSIAHKNETLELSPDLIIVAEGANSSNLRALGLRERRSPVTESWYFANFAHDESDSRVAMIGDHRSRSPSKVPIADISNCIVNGVTGEVNVAVRFRPGTAMTKEAVVHRLQRSAELALQQRDGTSDAALTSSSSSRRSEIRWMTEQPVNVENRKIEKCTAGDNVIIAGDTGGSGSPLAGLGASLSTSAYVALIGEVGESLKKSDPNALAVYGDKMSSYVDLWHQTGAKNEKAILGEQRLQLSGTRRPSALERFGRRLNFITGVFGGTRPKLSASPAEKVAPPEGR